MKTTILIFTYILTLLGSASSYGQSGGNPPPLTPGAFVTVWRTTQASETITIPTEGSGYSYTVKWGDSKPDDTGQTGSITHTYDAARDYIVTITGTFPRIYFNGNNDYRPGGDDDARRANAAKILEVKQWGNQVWTSMERAFFGCNQLQITAADVPDLSSGPSMRAMFANATAFNSDISGWNVSNATTMQQMFQSAASFDKPLNGWNVSKVTNMRQMFASAAKFNQDLSNWNVAKVTDMMQMFASAAKFNQDLSNWNVAKVTNMMQMFARSTSFNGDLNGWNVSQVTTMSGMFGSATAFNQNIGSWNVSSVTDISAMFYDAAKFDQDISSWKVSKVTTADNIFTQAAAFSQKHYTYLLIKWAELDFPNRTIKFGAPKVKYCNSAKAAFKTLDDTKNWDFQNDLGEEATCHWTPQGNPKVPTQHATDAPTTATITLTIPAFSTWGKDETGNALQAGSLALHYKTDVNPFSPVFVSNSDNGAVRIASVLTPAGGKVVVSGLTPSIAYQFQVVATSNDSKQVTKSEVFAPIPEGGRLEIADVNFMRLLRERHKADLDIPDQGNYISKPKAAAFAGMLNLGNEDEATAENQYKVSERLTIKSLAGIEAFVNITALNVNVNALNKLDLSNNIKLEHLDAVESGLTSLKISANTALKELDVRFNQLQSLDVSQNKLLTSLSAGANVSLSCIQVSADQMSKIPSGWRKSPTAQYNVYCPNAGNPSNSGGGTTGSGGTILTVGGGTPIINNHKPKISLIEDQTVALGSELKVPLSATDKDNPEELFYSLDVASKRKNMEIKKENGKVFFTWTPTLGFSKEGKHKVKVTVKDHIEVPQQDTTSFVITVTAAQVSSSGVLSLPAAENALWVSPIPTTRHLTVRMKNTTIGKLTLRLSTLLGNVVWERAAQKAHEVWEQSMDLSTLPDGVYMLEVIADGQHWTRKVVKE